MSTSTAPSPPDPGGGGARRHSVLDDAQGLALGVFLCGLSLHLVTFAGLVTGQTAGIAVLVSYATGWAFGPVFFVINLPFYALAWVRLGWRFTAKSLLSVTALSLWTGAIPGLLAIERMAPWLAAVTAGALAGIGLLAMFRHGGSLGGLGVVALIVQDRSGFRAGYLQLAVDAAIFAVAFWMLPATTVLWSMLGALVLNLIIAVNHRRDWYVAT